MEELHDRLSSLEKLIQEYTVIDGELASLKPGKSVYTRQASGLVYYKVDPISTHSQHKYKLDEMKREHTSIKQEIEKLKKKPVK